MLGSLALVILQTPFAVAMLCLVTGIMIYFAAHHVPERFLVLSRNRSQLLSVGAGMLLLFWILQSAAFRKSGESNADAGALNLAAFDKGTAYLAWDGSIEASRAVVTYHNDNARTGQFLNEVVLTPENVNATRFGKLYSFPVDGPVYAQPLYVPQVAIPGNGVHNLVFVATQHDSVYAFDADSSSPTPLWRVNFLNPDAGIGTVPARDMNTADIVPEIGITSTPAIDLSSNTLYVVAATKENGAFYHRLHALDLTSGAEKFAGPQVIKSSYPGNAQESSGGLIAFDSRYQLQRAALLLKSGKLYIAFASYGDLGPYHGWVLAYDATTLKQSGRWVSTPNGYQGGIWMSGCGISSDDDGNLFFSVANGPFDAYGTEPGADFSDSIVRLQQDSDALRLTDFFTPYSQAKMAENDLDLGSAGVLVLPDQPGAYPHLAVTSAKNGHIYLLNRDDLGGYSADGNRNPQLVQEISGVLRQQMGTPTYWNGYLYFGAGVSPARDSIKAFRLRNGILSRQPSSQTAAIYQVTRNTVSVSADGNSNGIVWSVQSDGYYAPSGNGAAVVHAYDAKNLARELYNSNQRVARDNLGAASKFTVPTIANGKVFVAGFNQVSVYGLLNP
jgi:hypothetical protein